MVGDILIRLSLTADPVEEAKSGKAVVRVSWIERREILLDLIACP